MIFEDFTYHSINVDEMKTSLEELNEAIQKADSQAEFMSLWKQYDTLYKDFDTNVTLCSIRHSIHTKDPYYAKENQFYDEKVPELEASFQAISKSIVHSKWMEGVKDQVPPTYFAMKEMEEKSFSPEIVPELQEENRLASKYQSLIASAEISFEGKIYNLSSLEVKMTDASRDCRKKATKAYWGWFEAHKDELLEIFDGLVQVRTKMAQKLGYENYIPLGYYRMNRFDYNQDDVKQYRQEILKEVVPVAQKLYASQKARLHLDHLYAWDEKVEFTTGNPKPHVSQEECVKLAGKMYRELSDSTGSFFQSMMDSHLMDLQARADKAAGGYCTYIPNYESPFIFANFNGTSSDVETLTHEAGHAYQVWSSRSIFPFECVWPTYETCEIHSMSMEFITYPWMHSFFKEETNKYLYHHMSGAIKFLPYGVLVDHFQHEIYAHPEYSSQERMACWRKLEKMYLPHKDYSEIPFLEQGGWWMRQLHIFMDPFYYIDYTLAQVCALQFWSRFEKKDPQAFSDYQKICSIGGKYPFRQVVELAGLKVPFQAGCLVEVMKEVETWLAQFDQNTL